MNLMLDAQLTEDCQARQKFGSFLFNWGIFVLFLPPWSRQEESRHQMQRVAFPYNLSIGADIVYLPRIRRLVNRREGRSLIPFAKRILHPLEIRDLSHRHPHWQTQHTCSESIVNWLGGRFAAKEAARKAMGATTLGWKDVRVEVTEGSGQPRIICATRDVNNQDIEHEAKLSISHDGDYVVATVLAVAPSEFGANGHSEGSARS